VRRLIEDMLNEQAALTRAILGFSGRAQAGEDTAAAKASVQSWAALHRDQVQAARQALEDIEAAGGGWSFAKLTIVNAALGALAAAAR
jgi:glutamate dehydrogenase